VGLDLRPEDDGLEVWPHGKAKSTEKGGGRQVEWGHLKWPHQRKGEKDNSRGRQKHNKRGDELQQGFGRGERLYLCV